MLYLDHSATTKPYDEVIATVAEVMGKVYGNPSSLHGLGVEAERLMKQAKEVIAHILGISSKEIVFTSGGSESNNLAIKGVAKQYKKRGNHVITSIVEHPAVFDAVKQLEQEGFRVTYLPVDHDGRVDVERLKQELTDETILVSIMHVNNEIGTVQPIEQIGQLLKAYPKVLFHVDGVQGFGKIPLSLKSAGIDLYSISAHKIHGPKGVGLLYKREGVSLYPLISGGGQENGLRSGTENVPGIVGMTKAMRMILEVHKRKAQHVALLKQQLITAINKSTLNVRVNSPHDGSPHIVHLSFPEHRGEVIVHALEEKGIYVSTKSACSSKLDKPSRILQAIGLEDAYSSGAIRISLSYENTEDDIETLMKSLEETVTSLEKVAK